VTERDDRVFSRRGVLGLLSGATVGGMAGCTGDGGNDEDTPGGTEPAERTTTGTATRTDAPTATATPADTVAATPTQTPPWDAGLIRAMSFNIRYDNPDDDPPWTDRRDGVIQAIANTEPDVVGLQEVLSHQFEHVREQLPGYEWYGVGRRGGDDGEHTPLGWRPGRFEALDRGTFWLSETPDEPGSVSWNANLSRIASWVDLEERATGLRARAYSTHFSHVSEEARINSSTLLRERIEDRIVDGRMSILLGDFNFEPGSSPYLELTQSGLGDARRMADSVEGPEGTFQGFGGEPGRRIDYVFLPVAVAVNRFRTLPTADPIRSDHLPVVADIDRDSVDAWFG
jgi:endonuclease/exonuclease/phosphatase family metal-dependent hydrolase